MRRYYRLTEPGGEVLAVEVERMRRDVEAATARLRATRPSRNDGTGGTQSTAGPAPFMMTGVTSERVTPLILRSPG
ncbi:hypothetical protein Aau02nite_91120 [Amorphoplanes auranticolor]|uniref:Uncharacterized protein n=1 Tax=Actinoplanes auranticolor TaxID=47988 RepID=A0A919VZM5_9ACTN|nr:hypothetical protein Aau02nite_91120 [Actinoplanes auranticolor]